MKMDIEVKGAAVEAALVHLTNKKNRTLFENPVGSRVQGRGTVYRFNRTVSQARRMRTLLLELQSWLPSVLATPCGVAADGIRVQLKGAPL